MALPELLLPATAGPDTAGPELLQQQCPELLDGLAALQDAAGEDVQRLADACAESLRHSEARPKEGPGALGRLRLFVLPQTSLALLLAGLTAGERPGLQPQTRPCLLGLLKKARLRFDKNRMNTIRFILQTRLLNVCAHAHG